MVEMLFVLDLTVQYRIVAVVELGDLGEYRCGAVLGADPASDLGCPDSVGGLLEAGAQRMRKGARGQLGQRQRVWRDTETVQPGRPEGLVDQGGNRCLDRAEIHSRQPLQPRRRIAVPHGLNGFVRIVLPSSHVAKPSRI